MRYGLFEATVSIADLQTYGSTRQTSSVLQSFLNYLPEMQAEFQSLLQTRIPMDVAALDRVLNGTVGQVFLKQVAEAIATQVLSPKASYFFSNVAGIAVSG